jgi:hypothetical protein
MLTFFKAARRTNTSLLAICTPDPSATVRQVVESFNGTAPPIIQWDIVRGITALNTAGTDVMRKISEDPALETNPIELLKNAPRLPAKTILFVHNAHRFFGIEAFVQAVWNLRDVWKADFRTLVLLGPEFTLPIELKGDVVVIDEPLPDEEQLRDIVVRTYKNAKLAEPAAPTVTAAIDALCGLAPYPAEQASAMSLTREGLDNDSLWKQKRQMIEQTRGLKVYRGGQTFDDIGGCDRIKSYMTSIINSPKIGIRAVGFFDEIEKMFAGIGSDSTGLADDYLGQLLTYMEDREASGVIFIGPPGAAKSAIAKATGAAAQKPLIYVDTGGMKGSLVGQSESALRTALKVLDAVGQGKVLFIATCNKIATLPPELRRRFTWGTFFFDLPTEDERAIIWDIYRKKYGLSAAQYADLPDDSGWTGAEIRQCARIADAFGCTLSEAAVNIVPVALSMGDDLTRLREGASGRYLSASQPGKYHYDRSAAIASGTTRAILTE